MPVVFNELDKVAGDPQASVDVEIALLWDDTDDPFPTVPGQSFTIRGRLIISTDEDGRWSTELVSNDEITPADSVYEVRESLGSDSIIYYISVPNQATPVDLWVAGLLVDKPGWA